MRSLFALKQISSKKGSIGVLATIFCLAFIVTFFIATNLIWLSADTLVPSWDQSGHMTLSLKYYRLIGQIKSMGGLSNFLFASNYYPPFFHMSALPVIYLLGFSENNVIFVNFLYLIILVLGMFFLGKNLFNRRVGVMSAALVVFYPIVFGLSREYLIDVALTSMVVLVQYLIIKSDGGVRKYWNLLLGAAMACAILTKHTAIFFFFPTWIIVFLWTSRSRMRWNTLSSVLAVIAILAGPWYFHALKEGISNAIFNVCYISRVLENDPMTFILSLCWYNSVIKTTLLSLNLLLFFIVGFVLFLIFDRRWKVFFILMSWITIPYIALVLFPNKDPRHIMPIIPAIAIFTIGGIDALPKRFIRNMFYSIIFIIGFIQFNNLSFNLPPFLVKEKDYFYNHSPLKHDWKVNQIVKSISDETGDKKITIGVLPNCRYFNPNQFILYIALLDLPYSVKVLGDSPVTLEQLKECDLLITKTMHLSVDYTALFRDEFYKEFKEKGPKKYGFEKVMGFALPDDSQAIVYKRESTS